MPGPTQALSPNGENNNDIIQDNGTIIPFRKHTVRGERSYSGTGEEKKAGDEKKGGGGRGLVAVWKGKWNPLD
ncbi:UNVERIFIED_CONTAM: hypothetical protein K2H54_046749 [Gekko kuhli]